MVSGRRGLGELYNHRPSQRQDRQRELDLELHRKQPISGVTTYGTSGKVTWLVDLLRRNYSGSVDIRPIQYSRENGVEHVYWVGEAGILFVAS